MHQTHDKADREVVGRIPPTMPPRALRYSLQIVTKGKRRSHVLNLFIPPTPSVHASSLVQPLQPLQPHPASDAPREAQSMPSPGAQNVSNKGTSLAGDMLMLS